MEKNDDKDNKGRGKKKYELSVIDLRFLKTVDVVIAENKSADIKLASDSAISTTVYGTRSIIGKIRSSQRGVTTTQIEKFAIYFNLDFNCFFRDIAKIDYDPNSLGDKIEVKDNAQFNSGTKGRNIQVSGGAYNETNNNYEKGAIKKQVLYAENIFKKSECPSDFQKKCRDILENIQDESASLESILDRKTESLKKITNLWKKEITKRELAEKERDTARRGEQEITKKYISLLEKIK